MARGATKSGPLVAAPRLEHVFDARIRVAAPFEVGLTRSGERRIIAITGGRVEGARLSGAVLPGGADYQTIAPDGCTYLHARYIIETDERERIYVENEGIRFGPKRALDRLRRGLNVDPTLVYFRTAPRFETQSPRLAWMMTTLFVASGARTPDEVLLSVFRV
ncbi:MAG: DUF3237 domain-containing protein [Hyphomicrobiales bacterium]|nr:DUF3237 domain-containing protein [Hyphomicrobiales bacterium]MBV9430630.1 DUF3237 domain-containing protein [Hyphomicrobiales bacterium]MBV9741902.1 DUF3237 domain-containing protein [Hyphomicrobiales bacterium]